MGVAFGKRRQICFYLFTVLLVVGFSCYGAAAHQCNHGHHHHNHDLHEHNDDVVIHKKQHLLPEEIAEEEDLKMMLDHHDHQNVHKHDGGVKLSGFGLWINAMGCSLLVSLASLICLILLPLLFIHGKPSKALVDSLALFGAGAMLGDAFLHQLPHAFGGGHSHSHDHSNDHTHGGMSHSHSLEDLSTGLSILAGIVLFLVVEKLVRYIENFSGGVNAWGPGHHHHHHHKHSNKLKDDADIDEIHQGSSNSEKSGSLSEDISEGKESDDLSADTDSGSKPSENDVLRKRNTGTGTGTSKGNDLSTENISNGNVESINQKDPVKSQSNLVFGYLNLFSDGVHNFTDGMALGSAFLLYGSVGGWSRTLFLLAHELPQEIGDFGILVRSGFSVSKALFFNFLSALVALVGTALALIWGTDPGQSSLIEGFTAGGFIYIALGVVGEMNNGTSALKSTAIQLVSLVMGMAIALCISLVE